MAQRDLEQFNDIQRRYEAGQQKHAAEQQKLATAKQRWLRWRKKEHEIFAQKPSNEGTVRGTILSTASRIR